MSGDRKTPKRRFKEFQGTEGWEKHKLGDTVSITMGQSPDGTTYREKPSDYILVQGNADLKEGWVYPRVWTTQKTKTAEAGDLIMSVRAPAGAMGKTAYDAVIGRGVAAIKGNEFIYQALVRMEQNGYWKKLSCGSTFESLNSENIFNAEIAIPNVKEQKNVGDYFSKLDKIITLNQRKLEKLKALKKAYLTQMFPDKGKSKPKLRFAGFNDEWEECKLGDVISDLKSGLSRMLSNNDIGLPVIRANNIDDGHLDLLNDIKYWYINDPQGANINNYLIEKDDLLINFINSESKMGTAAIVTETPIRKTIYTTNILRLRTNEKCYNKFLLALTMTNNYKEYIKGISKTAVNQASFTTVDYKNYDMLIPSIIEQQKIGVLLDKIDKLILLYQRKLEKLQNLKKAYLNEMFI